MMDDDTVINDSNLGQRLEKLSKTEAMYLVFAGKNIPLITKISIGRSRKNDIIIDDILASRFHAVIQKIKSEFFIKDTDSTNGTFLNDKELPKDKYVKLKENDIIKIGRTELNIKSFVHG
jgi:ATP-dependent protease HslVU (ClpYQ) ATPase subunit